MGRGRRMLEVYDIRWYEDVQLHSVTCRWSSNNDMASNYRVVIRLLVPPSLTCTLSSPCTLTTLGAVSPVHCKVLPVGRSYLFCANVFYCTWALSYLEHILSYTCKSVSLSMWFMLQNTCSVAMFQK